MSVTAIGRLVNFTLNLTFLIMEEYMFSYTFPLRFVHIRMTFLYLLKKKLSICTQEPENKINQSETNFCYSQNIHPYV